MTGALAGTTERRDAVGAAGRARQQFTTLATEQDRKAFIATLTDDERRLLYQNLSARDKERLAAAAPDRKRLSESPSDQQVKAWAGKIAANPNTLREAIQEVEALVASAQVLCAKGEANKSGTTLEEGRHKFCTRHPNSTWCD